MLRLLLALILLLPLVSRGDQFRRGQRNDGTTTQSFYAFAPSSGAGMGGSACQQPNWYPYSESASGTMESSGVAAITATQNYSTSPIGTLTADRLQIPSTIAGQYASEKLLVTPMPFSASACTFSYWVKGVSAVGVMDSVIYNGVNQTSSCSYTTNWTFCQHTLSSCVGTMYFYVGNLTSFGLPARSSQDVVIWGRQVNGGSSAPTYYATSGAAAGFIPVDAKGGSIVATRTGSAMCHVGGTRTTGISNGDLVMLPGNTPRIVRDYEGYLGIQGEAASTNQFLYSEKFDQTPQWQPQLLSEGGTVVTADYGVAPDGSTTADRVNIPATTIGYSAIFQSIATACSGVACVGTVFVKGVSNSGTTDMCANTGAGYTCSACNFTNTSWTRCNHQWTGIAGDAVYIGNMTSANGGTARAASDILLWGAQAELGVEASSYIPTTTVAVIRNADTQSITPALTTGADFSFAESFSGVVGSGGCAGIYFTQSTSGPAAWTCFNNTINARVVSTGLIDSSFTMGTNYAWNTGLRYAMQWDRATSVVTGYVNGVAGTPSASTPAVLSTAWTAISLQPGIHSRICADPTKPKCR